MERRRKWTAHEQWLNIRVEDEAGESVCTVYGLNQVGRRRAQEIAAAPELLEVAYATRKLVSEAASVGFNCTDGDWAVRLYANQARLSAAIAKAEGRA